MSVIDLERLLMLLGPLNDSPDANSASARFLVVSLASVVELWQVYAAILARGKGVNCHE